MPVEQACRRVIDEEKFCAAIEALGDGETLRTSAQRSAFLGDATRLRLLRCIAMTRPISVSDLAIATRFADDHVLQTLRYLRASQTVTAERDGRAIGYQLTDPAITDLLNWVERPR